MIPCPCCHVVFPLEAAMNDLAGRQAIVEAFKLTPFGDLLLGYTRLFTPPKRVLSNLRTVKLLEELLPMIREGKIERSGRIWSAPHDYWKQALGEMLEKRDKLTLPLKGHGYLLTIIEGYSSKAEATAEALQEDRKAGRTPVGRMSAALSDNHAADNAALIRPTREPAKPRSTMPVAVKDFLQRGKNNGHS